MHDNKWRLLAAWRVAGEDRGPVLTLDTLQRYRLAPNILVTHSPAALRSNIEGQAPQASFVIIIKVLLFNKSSDLSLSLYQLPSLRPLALCAIDGSAVLAPSQAAVPPLQLSTLCKYSSNCCSLHCLLAIEVTSPGPADGSTPSHQAAPHTGQLSCHHFQLESKCVR